MLSNIPHNSFNLYLYFSKLVENEQVIIDKKRLTVVVLHYRSFNIVLQCITWFDLNEFNSQYSEKTLSDAAEEG